MEGAGHINIAMIEDVGTNGTPPSKMSPDFNRTRQACGSAVSFHSIQYKVQMRSGFFSRAKPNPKEVLTDLNGIMRPGLNAILGPTGSGKSSFLDILAGRKDPLGLSGDVLIDGAPQPPNFKCLSGYVVQEDVVMGTLTVRQNLSFSAALRLPASVPRREKEARVDHLLRELCLTKVADTKVGSQLTRGISGGERKRTSIGMELIIDPAVLFLDEPTTGLDASTANSPHNNPADFFLDVINGDFMKPSKVHDTADLTFEELGGTRQNIEERLVEEFKNSSYASESRAELRRILQTKECVSQMRPRSITYNTSFLHQLQWVFQRTFQNLMLTPQTSVAQVGVNVFLALVVGAIFFTVQDDQSGLQNRMGALFFITTNQCFSTVSAAELFITERNLFVHEYISGYYRVSVYFLSKILCDLAMRTVTSVIFSAVVYFLIGLKSTVEAFLIFTFTVTLVAYTATAMTMAISANQSVVALANIFMTITFVFMMIFSGLLVNLPSIVDWLAWLKYFSIPRYGFAALKINEFVGLNFCEEPPIQNANMSAATAGCGVSAAGQMCTGEQYLDYLGIEYSSWGLWENHVALTVMMVVFLFVAYLKLRYIRKFT
uniref:Broad substrate specificity ATP-binding cassette transporter ABCG2 n=1 Tax=Poecilia reticulata TaxID=8081 RepID=A0A3P9MY65_POERE